MYIVNLLVVIKKLNWCHNCAIEMQQQSICMRNSFSVFHLINCHTELIKHCIITT